MIVSHTFSNFSIITRNHTLVNWIRGKNSRISRVFAPKFPYSPSSASAIFSVVKTAITAAYHHKAAIPFFSAALAIGGGMRYSAVRQTTGVRTLMELSELICRRKTTRSFSMEPAADTDLQQIRDFLPRCRPLVPDIRVRAELIGWSRHGWHPPPSTASHGFSPTTARISTRSAPCGTC